MYGILIVFCFMIFIVGLSTYNLFTKKYSNKAILLFAILILVFRIYYTMERRSPLVIVDSLVALVIAFLISYFIFGAKKGVIGGGDMKLIMCIGFMIGTIYFFVFALVSFIIMLSMGVLHYDNTFRKPPILPSGVIWILSFLAVFVLNYYWDQLMVMVNL